MAFMKSEYQEISNWEGVNSQNDVIIRYYGNWVGNNSVFLLWGQTITNYFRGVLHVVLITVREYSRSEK